MSWDKVISFLKERDAETQREMARIRASSDRVLLVDLIQEDLDKRGLPPVDEMVKMYAGKKSEPKRN